MIEFITALGVGNALIYTILLLIAVKEGLSLFRFFQGEGTNYFNSRKKKEESAITLEEVVKKLDEIDKKVVMLMESDKDDIKSWLVEKYQYYLEHPNKPIDAHQMEAIEKRYAHYQDEGGNGYIKDSIMPALRQIHKERCSL